MRKRKRVWVFYRWMRTDLHRDWAYIVSSKASWQLNRASMKSKEGNKEKYYAEVLAESNDRVMLEQMRDLTKEN